MEQTMNRRTFVQTAGAATAVASFACMAKIGKADEPTEVTWDYEADLVVVGGGGAGFCAGIEAAEAGCTVLVLEKSGTCGGDSYMCGGHVMCAGSTFQKEFEGVEGDSEEKLAAMREDTGEQFAEDMLRWAQGISNDEMIREMCIKSGEMADWLMSLGREFNTVEYIPPIWQFDDGRKIYPRCLVNDTTYYGGHFPYLDDKLNSYGTDLVTILTNTEATHLVRNNGGRVIGVEAEGEDGTIHVKAKKGVVISTAGIDHDLEMAKDHNRQQYWGLKMIEAGLSHPSCFDNSYNTGDGVRMGIEVGAGLACSPACCMNDLHYIGGVGDYATAAGHTPNQWEIYKFEGNILVNPRGKRFVQEDAEWGFVISKSVRELVDCGMNFDALDKHGHIICDADHTWVWTNGNVTLEDETVVSADTIEELAEKIGADPATLAKTVEEWNAYCETGVDPDFDRREDFGPIVTPPFYADIVRPGVLGSASGLKTNIETQVLDASGNVIPGLYAAGMSMGGNWMPPFCPGCGWAILGTMVWGRKAGQNIAAEQPWE